MRYNDSMSKRLHNFFRRGRTVCHACEGRGHTVTVTWMGDSVVYQCPACEGTGRIRDLPAVCTA